MIKACLHSLPPGPAILLQVISRPLQDVRPRQFFKLILLFQCCVDSCQMDEGALSLSSHSCCCRQDGPCTAIEVCTRWALLQCCVGGVVWTRGLFSDKPIFQTALRHQDVKAFAMMTVEPLMLAPSSAQHIHIARSIVACFSAQLLFQ